jgi:ferredoxin
MIKKVWIDDKCIGCQLAHDTFPEVFDFKNLRGEIREGIDPNVFEMQIKEAAELCPMGSIHIEEDS